MKHRIVTYPNLSLFEKARDIPKDQIKSETFSQIGSSMLEILKHKGGIGLSANQVGLPFNMCVVELHSSNPMIMLNPRITDRSNDTFTSEEGCLSLPGAGLKVERYKNVTVEYEDVTGETQEVKADGLLSACLQHEIDHLKGILMINRVTGYHKEKALKAMHKFKRRMRG